MLTRRLILAGGAAAAFAGGTQLDRTAIAQGAARLPVSRARAGAASIVRLNDMLFSAEDPAAVWQYAGPDTTRVFLRKGNWAIIWYLQEQSPVDGKPFDVVVVERQRWTNLAAEQAAVSYQASVFGKSFPVQGHGDFQR